MRRRAEKFDFYLEEMVAAARRILQYTKGLSYEEFTSSEMVRDAVIRNFEVMGESVKHVPYTFQREHRNVPWQHIFNLRNFIVHEYFDIDDIILWEIIKTDLIRNASDLEALVPVARAFHEAYMEERKKR